MPISIMEGNMLNAEDRILLRVCNCYGVWGAGIAPQIKEKWSEAHEPHVEYCKSMNHEWKLMAGQVQFSSTDDGKLIGNMFAMPVRRDIEGTVQVFRSFDHWAFAACLNKVSKHCLDIDDEIPTISIPYGIGCGLAGGNINVVNQLILDWSNYHNVNINLWVYNIEEWKASLNKWKKVFNASP